jgi:hypothetical protein
VRKQYYFRPSSRGLLAWDVDRLVRLSPALDTLVLFENAAHDFPQRIGYRRLGNDSLVAWIEGTRQGRTRRVEFPYGRVACANRV